MRRYGIPVKLRMTAFRGKRGKQQSRAYQVLFRYRTLNREHILTECPWVIKI